MADKDKRPGKRSALKPEQWKPRFLKNMRDFGVVRTACDYASISRRTAYAHRESDPQFKQDWEDALEDAIDDLERVARARGKTKSDRLIMFLLRAHRPGLYREQKRIEVDDVTARGALIDTALQEAEAEALEDEDGDDGADDAQDEG